MPLVTKHTTSIGVRQFGNRNFSRPVSIQVFEESQTNVISNNTIEIDFYTKNDVPLFSIAANVKDTILNKLKLTNDIRGCADATITLLSAPLYELQYGTKIRVKVGKKYLYTGYLFKPQSEFNSKRNTFEYKFFGLRQRYTKQKVNLTKYFISSIVRTGNTTIYNTSIAIPNTVFAGQRIGVRRCDNKVNNGYYLINDTTEYSITVTNYFGVNQVTSGGDLIILPAACSNSVELSEVFRDVAKEGVKAFPEIRYNPTKIEISPNKFTTGFIDIDSVDYDKIFETLEILSGNQYYMGVDEEGDFFFKKIPTDILDVLNTGYDMSDPGLTLNYNNIANLITGERSKARGTEGNGFDVVGTAKPESDALLSQAKYGVYSKRVQMPAYLSDSVIQDVIDNTLAINKEPRNSAKISNLKFDRFYKVGNYEICPLPDYYMSVVNECDSLTEWTSGDNISLSLNTEILITGNASIEINLSNLSNGQLIILNNLDIEIVGKKTISFWLFASVGGEYLAINISDGVNNYNYPVVITSVNQFFLVEIDIENTSLENITELYFEVNGVLENTVLYLDKISLRKFGTTHVRVPLKKAIYDLSPHFANIDLEFGDEGESLSEYLQGIQATVETQKLAAINRN